MKNEQGNIMTKEEAEKLLEEVLIALAKNAIHNNRLTDYADQLEHYIGYLNDKEKEDTKEQADDTKTE